MSELLEKAKKAKAITSELAVKTSEQKNDALRRISMQLLLEKDYIISENEKDIEIGKQNGLNESLIDRLRLTEDRIKDMAEALILLVELNDPVGEVLASWARPNGLKMKQIRVPLGVVGMVYEARPNVTVDASSLCLKTGNAVILRGSSSAIHSNIAIVNVIHHALEQSEIPADAVQLLEDTSRETAAQMFKLNEYFDVLIPRGGAGLIKTVVENSTIPVLETGVGNCHIYIDGSASKEMAINIAINAKTQRPSVCNAAETILIHEGWAKEHLEDLVKALLDKKVEIRGDEKVRGIHPEIKEAIEEDWGTEFLDLIVSMKIVENVDKAIAHINKYGSLHSEAIISETAENVERFFNYVDAAALYHNASTRFTDGFEFGFGAEIGISTQKLHARGPMGLPTLTSTKYIVTGTGQVR
ncbi:glutamate-5-semialdehyde dehydrogenase [Schinkia azotoformans MEV2011]|uniref:Gamma-glutamyl phosphate reductase n=1 Tax=Schinkia azotoformans MEV2011 TaxID=1348973 RepID=A0A072NH47_SCHAZ|nr:glutamate-5-semialdehyde dehydrogenase [Schinkia azotoformans]KEF36562.1 glutamate-5-semialdehyde dehydrogenase [Schinkia azotoformans MEV2011]MEC1696962.1 glutamate-5-semialdehyde dehydrogenase [Schinkia azotoformans]MEC1725832.1 glutamate-5-semialdehyde dehydrogenase [Schinkia azotoformans]MEC1772910.1 glutamate-5-semialdehyde dehydrogenase [Schinkia azotoformans]MEC1778284.1 glutamate-5-semialdehyde dehydrogenase [Schinkia azotoformans]